MQEKPLALLPVCVKNRPNQGRFLLVLLDCKSYRGQAVNGMHRTPECGASGG
jgi:hypothetical protein